ncbi:hypothetical protein INR49_018297 [Caranx melampygus]|nr:hypothetical protein INR49_018297 [Caranx melampygus]
MELCVPSVSESAADRVAALRPDPPLPLPLPLLLQLPDVKKKNPPESPSPQAPTPRHHVTAFPAHSGSRMGPVWLLLPLLLLPSLLRAQVTSNFTAGVQVEVDNSTDSSINSTRTSDLSSSLQPPPASGFAAAPTEAPTEPEDDWSPAEAFMFTGDPSTLEGARCSRAYSAPGQPGSLPLSFSAPLRPTLDALASSANFLNMIFQASDLRESTVQEDMEWYHALVRALLEADALIQRALLTFDADPVAVVPQLVLCATRSPTAKVQTIVLQDLSKAWESLHPPAPAPDDSWFRSFKFPQFNQPMAALSKRVLLNDLSTLDTPKWGQGDSYVTNRSGVRWASAPFLECMDGRFVPGWMLTLSTSFYGLKPDLTPEFRGVIRVDVNIQDIDLDQCATGDNWFADTHQCNRTSMECVPIPGRGFRLGQYCCRCKQGYYNPELAPEDADGGGPVNATDGGGTCYPNMPICLPCWPGCKSCQDGAPCWVQEDWLLRAAVLAVQGVFMLLIFVSMLAAYRHRRNRRIRASGLLLLETILFGSLLLYFPVFIMYFKPSTFRCILLRWVRMLGFSIVYGTVTLKMYRVLKVFLSRTAQRVPYMSSLHLLRILGVMLMTVSWFLCAWTVGVLQNRDRNIPVFITATTSDGQGFNLCYLDRWDYMMAVAELLFLCWGSSLWTAVRPVPSAFHEPRYMGIAIHNELLLSSMFHLFRFTFPSLHPDWMLLLSFTHTHVTITVTLALLFIPKFLHVSKSGREEIAAEVYEDEVDLRRSGSYLNSSFHSAWSEHSVDPDDFRDELKKLYAQLEVHKTKKMTANNPHLSKKRSSRCTLGRSIIKRIAEFPESMSRQCSREERDGSFRSRSVHIELQVVTEDQGLLSAEEFPADISTEDIDDESKANLALGRRDAMCPWEMVRTRSGSFTDNASDVFTWEPENIPEEDEEDDAECAAEALMLRDVRAPGQLRNSSLCKWAAPPGGLLVPLHRSWFGNLKAAGIELLSWTQLRPRIMTLWVSLTVWTDLCLHLSTVQCGAPFHS